MLKFKNTIYIAVLLSGILLVVLSFRNQQVSFQSDDNVEKKKNLLPNIQGEKSNRVAGNIIYNPPADWIRETPSSSMRLAQFVIPSEYGENCKLNVFNNIGGSVEQNLDRWIKQFRQSDGSSSKDKAIFSYDDRGGGHITYIYITGTFLSGGMMMNNITEKSDFAMHAAIIEFSDDIYYFKMTGPQQEMDNRRVEFRNFINNISYGH